jgi:hypothetical protein
MFANIGIWQSAGQQVALIISLSVIDICLLICHQAPLMPVKF